MIITAGRQGEQLCWSEPWTRFSARTGLFSSSVLPSAVSATADRAAARVRGVGEAAETRARATRGCPARRCDGAPLADSREDVSEHIARLSRILFVIPEPEVTPGAGGGPEPVIPAVAERPEKLRPTTGTCWPGACCRGPGGHGQRLVPMPRRPGCRARQACCGRRHRPGGYRAVTALSLTLSTLPSLTRHRTGNKLMRAPGPSPAQPADGGTSRARHRHLARDRETARHRARAERPAPLPGQRGSTVQAAAATWRTRS